MDTIRKPIGGEFWFEEKLQSEDIISIPSNKEVLLNGGKSAIELILSDIEFKEDEILLLPSYLCPTIVDFIVKSKVNYKFYNVNKDLSLNLQDINNLINKNQVKAIFFIDYFGFYHNKKTLDQLLEFQNKGIILIEDAVQMFWIKKNNGFIGDYIFNSYRKFLPIDGSIVIGIEDKVFEEIEDDYYNLMKKARNEKSIYINEGKGEEGIFLKDFDIAHDSYYRRGSINAINSFDKGFLRHVPIEVLNNIRLDNYKYLKQELNGIDGVEVIFNEDLGDNIPLCIPIFVNRRDEIRRNLMGFNIYCPVHWNLKNEEWADEYKDALEVSKRILSIPIDWRYDINDMEYIIECFKKQF
jgi:dTDP-4-amino-4,6-dideoxygalactose transaminase